MGMGAAHKGARSEGTFLPEMKSWLRHCAQVSPLTVRSAAPLTVRSVAPFQTPTSSSMAR